MLFDKIESSDYGLIAYLLLKYKGKIEKIKKENKLKIYIVKLEKKVDPMKIELEYSQSDFETYNRLLKKVIKYNEEK